MMAMQMMAQELEVNTSELAGRELEAAVLNKAASLLEEVVGVLGDLERGLGGGCGHG